MSEDKLEALRKIVKQRAKNSMALLYLGHLTGGL